MTGAGEERRGDAAREPAAPGTGPGAADGGEGAAFHCPRCASTNVRRSKAKTAGERLLRYLTPFHYYRCRKCGHRGLHLGRVPTPPAGHEHDPSKTPGRPLERRDLEEALERRKRLLWTVLLAVALGALAGKYVHSCQQRAEQAAPE